MDCVEPEGVKYHWHRFEDVEIPLVVQNELAESAALAWIRDGLDSESFDGSEDAANEHERSGPVQHDAELANIAWKHACFDTTSVNQEHEADEEHFHSRLQHE